MVTRYSGEWKTVKLGDCGKFISGNGFPLSYQGKQRGAYPFYKVSDMNNDGNGFYMIKANNYISVEIARTLSCNIIPQGAIVFAKIGAAIFLERKRITTCDCCIDNNMMAFLPNSDISSIFMCFMMERMKFGNFAQTTALPSLSGKNLAELQVDLPPMDEQIAIAETLSALDRHLANLSALIAKKQAIRQGALEDLMTGRTRLWGVTGDWKEAKLGEIGTFIKGAALSKADITNSGTPFILYGELYTTYGEVTYNVYRRTKKTVSSQHYSRVGDVIMPTSGETAEDISSATCVMIPGVILAGDLCIFRTDKIDGRFLSFALNHIVKDQVAEIAQGISIIHVRIKDLANITVRFPTLEEQSAIAHTLAALDSEISALISQHSKLSAIRSAAINDLLSGKIRLTL